MDSSPPAKRAEVCSFIFFACATPREPYAVGRIRCKCSGCFSPDDMKRKPEDWIAAEIEQRRSRFCSVWQVIEEAELVDEYEAWKEANPNA